jgi:redox-sensitive bicupin YhaK (pirin superfamily)
MTDPSHPPDPRTDPIDLVIAAKGRDLGGFSVRRALPSVHRRMVGPFIFFDHMGPAQFAAGEGIDVRPHPHIGLATVTYLFEGEIVHRDSLGFVQPIRPGDVNWMTAGRGITHSERTGVEVRQTGSRLHGIQCWVALPLEHEETEPAFVHHPGSSIPSIARDGARLRVVLGSAFGVTSPVSVLSPTLYIEAEIDEGAALTLPDEHADRAAYVVEGTVECGAEIFAEGSMIVFHPGKRVVLRARTKSRVVVIGGEKMATERHIEWNFVSSSLDRIERAKRDWRQRRFSEIPGDSVEFIPLPDR